MANPTVEQNPQQPTTPQTPQEGIPQPPQTIPAPPVSTVPSEPPKYPLLQQPQATPKETPIESTAEFQQFNQQLQQYLGVDVAGLKAALGSVNTLSREYQVGQLRQVWGESYADTYKAVEARLQTMPPEVAARYNNVEGAMMIAQVIEAERIQQAQQQQQAVPGSQPPLYNTSSPTIPTTQPEFKFKKSELDAMDYPTKQSRWGEIQHAYANGLIDFNS